MSKRGIPRVKVGDPVAADLMNRLIDSANLVNGFAVSDGFTSADVGDGRVIGPSGAEPFPARLTGSSSPYGLVEQYVDGLTWTDLPGGRQCDACADELNEVSGLSGKKIVEMWPVGPSRYAFTFSRRDTSQPCVCSGTHTAHVTLSDTGQAARYAIAVLRLDGNNVQSRIVDASGNAVFSVAPRRPCGDWSIKVCLWGFEPVVVDLDGDCPEDGGTTEISLTPITSGITLALTDANGTYTASLTPYTWPSYVDGLGVTQPGFTAYGWQWCYEMEIPAGGCRVQLRQSSPYVEAVESCGFATAGPGPFEPQVPITTAFGYSLYFFPKMATTGLYQLSPKFFMSSWYANCFWYYDDFNGYVHTPICTGSTNCFGEAGCGDWDPQDRDFHPECKTQRFSSADDNQFRARPSNAGNDAGFCRPYNFGFAFPKVSGFPEGPLYDPRNSLSPFVGSKAVLLSEV